MGFCRNFAFESFRCRNSGVMQTPRGRKRAWPFSISSLAPFLPVTPSAVLSNLNRKLLWGGALFSFPLMLCRTRARKSWRSWNMNVERSLIYSLYIHILSQDGCTLNARLLCLKTRVGFIEPEFQNLTAGFLDMFPAGTTAFNFVANPRDPSM